MRGALVLVVSGLACSGPGDATSPETVRVTVYDFGALAAGVPVWFGDPQSGELIVEGVTDSGGTFAAAVPAGASVNAAIPQAGADPPAWRVYTMLGTRPGDDVILGVRRAFDSTPLGTVEITLPGPFAGAAGYEVTIGCREAIVGDPSLPLPLAVPAYCVTSGGEVLVLGHALDASEQPVAYASALVSAPAGGGAVSAALGPWRTDFATLTVAVANMPEGVDIARTEVSFLLEDLPFLVGRGRARQPAAGVTFATEYRFPADAATALFWKAMVIYPSPTPEPDGAQLRVRSVRPPYPASDTYDLAASPLPRLTMTTGAIGANGSPSLACVAVGDPAGADGVAAYASWDNPNGTSLYWELLAPPTAATALTFPALPAALEQARGVPAWTLTPGIFLVDADLVTGYEEFRERYEEVLDAIAGRSSTTDVRVDVSIGGSGI